MAAVGEDFADYRLWLEEQGVDTSGIKPIPGEFTSSCFINTDLQDNQITAFYPGAMSQAHTLSFRGDELQDAEIVVISPNDPLAMQSYAAECVELGIPYLYDPSMQAPRMTAEELRAGCAGAKVLIGNDYEFGMMSEKMGITESELHQLVPITVVTKGEQGASIFVEGDGVRHSTRQTNPGRRSDGSGRCVPCRICQRHATWLPWDVVGRIASLSAVYAIEHPGTQQHSLYTTGLCRSDIVKTSAHRPKSRHCSMFAVRNGIIRLVSDVGMIHYQAHIDQIGSNRSISR